MDEWVIWYKKKTKTKKTKKETIFRVRGVETLPAAQK